MSIRTSTLTTHVNGPTREFSFPYGRGKEKGGRVINPTLHRVYHHLIKPGISTPDEGTSSVLLTSDGTIGVS